MHFRHCTTIWKSQRQPHPIPFLQEGTKNGCKGPQEQVKFPLMGLALHWGTKTACSCSQGCGRRATHDGGVHLGTREEVVAHELVVASRVSWGHYVHSAACEISRPCNAESITNGAELVQTARMMESRLPGACWGVWEKNHSSVVQYPCDIFPPWEGRAAEMQG